ncbi:hypothetical protein FACS1894181_00300 [Bacteroidia bacterium]|nr:hypothetical protein FACS1894181_00300 [Bacteroidia bacterium]
MVIDEASHAEFVDKILGIVGTTFANNQETLGKRNQQPLFLFGDRKSFKGKLSNSHHVKVNIYDGTGNRIAAFDVDNQASIGGMRKQLKSISFDGKGNSAINIIANPDTPMGMITDVKQAFRDFIGIKANYRMSNM